MAEQFLIKHSPKLRPRTLVEYRHIVTHCLLPVFGTQPVASIVRPQVSSAHASWKAHPRRANFALTVLSKLMSWCENEGFRPDGSNPVRRVDRFTEAKRQRYLTSAELQQLGIALARAEREHLISPFAVAALRLLILTGARLSEILTLQWSFVDTERAMLFLPDSKTGAKTIPLNTAALDILKTLPRTPTSSSARTTAIT
ncbi:MAG: site-specific integrase [Hyphomicrobiaceae bacterium]|nr:site-specific integrase [Hyphomicrobiaceae bacterium]